MGISLPFAFSELGEGARRADEVVLTVCRCVKAVQIVTTTSSPPTGGASPSLEKPRRGDFHSKSMRTRLAVAAFLIKSSPEKFRRALSADNVELLPELCPSNAAPIPSTVIIAYRIFN